MEYNKYSLMGILNLTRQYQQDIYDRKPLASVLSNRNIRFINPEGKFDYTTFGNFYFPSPNRMMLITKDRKYTKYHKCDQLGSTLWSTVPVIFAGVSTRCKDDTGREIYSGDVVSAKNLCFTSVVRYMSCLNEPSLMGDNCDLLFSDAKEGLHIVGTTFFDLTREMYSFCNTVEFLRGDFVYKPSTEFFSKVKSSKDKPQFCQKLDVKKCNAVIYEDIEKLILNQKGEYALAYLCEDIPDSWSEMADLPKEERGEIMHADNLPENYMGKTIEIKLKETDDFLEKFREPFEKFMIEAHRSPETTFILCDFINCLELDDYTCDKIAIMLKFLSDYEIDNVIVPCWIGISWASFDCVGKD